MAKLVKLQICGIRSFGPFADDVQQVKFSSPLTLFLGQNGCGKTTIIESLKYACTGDLPGGTKSGQGFVNDPKITNSTVTKGQVKLKVVDAKGNEIIISRPMQVTQKANNLVFSTLPPTLRITDVKHPDNPPQDISGRCADIDTYVCQALNISPTIVNNVIFCHQENSSWPLEEGKKLKERFDEIFDSVEYNNCINLLLKNLKDKKSNLKTTIVQLDYKKEAKERVEKEKNKLEDRRAKLQSLNDQIDVKKQEMNPIEKRIQEILDLETVLGELQRTLTGKEEARKGIIEQQESIRNNIPVLFEGSDAELQNRIEEFESDKKRDEELVNVLERKSREFDEKIKELNTRLEHSQIKLGQLKEERNQHEFKIAERESLLENAKEQLTLVNIKADDVNMLQQLNEALQKEKQSFEQLEATYEKQETELEKIVYSIQEKTRSTKQSIESKQGIVKECNAKIKKIQSTLQELDMSDEQLSALTKKIQELEKTLANIIKMFNEPEKVQEIEQCNNQINQLEQRHEKLEREFRILQQNHVTEEKLESENENIILKQSQVNKIKIKNSQHLQHLFEGDIPEKDLRKAVKTIQDRDELVVKNYTEKINKTQKEVTTMEAKLEHLKDSIREKERELKESDQKVSQLCRGKPFEQILKETYTKKEKLQKDKGQYSSAKVMYEAFIEEFQNDSPCCPVCQTDFAQKRGAVTEIISKIQNKIERIPSQLRVVEKELKKEEEFYNKLQQIKPVSENLEVLSCKIPFMKDELNEMSESFNSLSNKLTSLKNDIKIPQSNIEACKHLISEAALYDQYQMDILKSQTMIRDLTQQIVVVSSNKSRQETEAEIDTINAELSNLRKMCESKKKTLEQHKKRCQDLNDEKYKNISKQLQFQTAMQEKPIMEKQLTEYTDKLEVLSTEIEDLQLTLSSFENDLSEAKDNRTTVVKKNKKSLEEARKKLDVSRKLILDIEKVHASICKYINDNNDAKLQTEAEVLDELKQKKDNVNAAKEKLIDGISKKKEEIAQKVSTFRSLRDNKLLREKLEKEKVLTQEILELKKNIGDHNYRSIYKEKEKLIQKREVILNSINSIQGQTHELEAGVKELETELDKPQNKFAYKNYRSKLYELAVAKAAITDLNNYIKALEKAVLQFHKKRMTQINKIIRELWRSIYKGNDIDYIEIQAEDSSRSNVKRSYDYKVVQVKKGVALEMRGRCSAGQKVLACLVIRMALAETFSANCGILALDEPTTNLDRMNIDSLSDALARIVETRANEKNFQLLIITHDEDFLNTLTRSQSISHFWRVSRNEEGFSIITKENL